jgi:hypothetical protein
VERELKAYIKEQGVMSAPCFKPSWTTRKTAASLASPTSIFLMEGVNWRGGILRTGSLNLRPLSTANLLRNTSTHKKRAA